ncbi:SDR family NAD(P)-dependent oxidoreductase [Natrarchaeobius chitinivorans]|uniref:SDR family NAD(P)-dependent oxidoreductase n=1 Tax=Natrarchaeobius chitinivorans TaxID=1679083 RepID=A0A3N6MKW0_NATCH|nr:SDR family NAD(P)-dependent oxidoreductase [Natrarchaeobius chitinivorans]RQG96611.1 SDR family NAD(P)-dependent oxidoreductase [Natrarchaeobius chitinivorans]
MDGQTAVVTGGTRGIGRAVADAFAAEGATVVVGARDAAAVETVVEDLTDAGATAAGIRTDVRDEYDVERLAETASKAGDSSHQGIDVVVAAAGVYHGDPGETPMTAESYTLVDDHWRTNARGVFATIRETLPHLNDGARVLVPTGSVARAGKPGYGSYAVSKAAAEAIARGFDADTDHVVWCLDPGQVATELTNDTGRDPESVAGMFVWAATDADASELDGAVLDLATWKRATR